MSLSNPVGQPWNQRNASQQATHTEKMLEEAKGYAAIPPSYTYIALGKDGERWTRSRRISPGRHFQSIVLQ